MKTEEIVKLLEKGFLPTNVKQYREIYKLTFQKEPPSCSCNDNKIFTNLKEHYKVK